jgi:activating signal cointegrator 1
MKALTIQQPSASLLAVGATSLLTSRQPTDERGPIAIYAAWTFPMADMVLLKRHHYREALGQHYFGDELDAGYLPTGAVVAVGLLTDCLSTNDPDNLPPLGSPQSYFADFTADRFIWRFDQVRRLEVPIKCGGARGFWELPASIADQLAVFA